MCGFFGYRHNWDLQCFSEFFNTVCILPCQLHSIRTSSGRTESITVMFTETDFLFVIVYESQEEQLLSVSQWKNPTQRNENRSFFKSVIYVSVWIINLPDRMYSWLFFL